MPCIIFTQSQYCVLTLQLPVLLPLLIKKVSILNLPSLKFAYLLKPMRQKEKWGCIFSDIQYYPTGLDLS